MSILACSDECASTSYAVRPMSPMLPLRYAQPSTSFIGEPVMTSKKHTALPAAGKQAEPAIDSTDSRLDEALEESFPASDPIAVHEHEPRRASENEQPVTEKKRR